MTRSAYQLRLEWFQATIPQKIPAVAIQDWVKIGANFKLNLIKKKKQFKSSEKDGRA